MQKVQNDIEYLNLINNILNNEEFNKIKNIEHHGVTRFEHSLRVSYYSYKVSKILKLDYKQVATGGLLHDFFITDDLKGKKKAFSMFFHPYKSLENATKYFKLSEMEKDIIISHMFPSLPHKIPKYLESWLVSIVDKIVATYEFYYSYGKPYAYKFSNLYLVALLLKK